MKMNWICFWGKHTQPLLSNLFFADGMPFKANCNFRDCHGMTPLMEAAAANYAEARNFMGPTSHESFRVSQRGCGEDVG